MALSMEEQRILDAMERKLADDDPRLASRLSAFGQPHLPGAIGSGKARAALIALISLALAVLVTLMIYQMLPFPVTPGRPTHPAQRSRVVTSVGGQPATTTATRAAQPAS
ncbi:MAG: DUF3040 domain-containing protein [Streptosporangiaceae bacterium]